MYFFLITMLEKYNFTMCYLSQDITDNRVDNIGILPLELNTYVVLLVLTILFILSIFFDFLL